MSKRGIEDVIRDILKDDSQKNALDFAMYMNKNAVSNSDFIFVKNDEADESGWKAAYKDESICFMYISGNEEFPGPWTVWIDGDYIGKHTESVDEKIKEAAWENVAPCGSCGGKCTPGSRRTIFGKDFENVCNSTLMFTNPDAELLECMIKIADIRKNDIAKGV